MCQRWPEDSHLHLPVVFLWWSPFFPVGFLSTIFLIFPLNMVISMVFYDVPWFSYGFPMILPEGSRGFHGACSCLAWLSGLEAMVVAGRIPVDFLSSVKVHQRHQRPHWKWWWMIPVAQEFTGWWWLEHDFYFPIDWEQSSQLTNIFQRSWNHQPVQVGEIWSICPDVRNV